MPLCKPLPERLPSWCELHAYEVLRLRTGEVRALDQVSPRTGLIVVDGTCLLRLQRGPVSLAGRGAHFDARIESERSLIVHATDAAAVVHLCGNWGDDCGGRGVFTVGPKTKRRDIGDPVTYPKETGFDNHYHDCDEYWIIVEGSGIAVSEGRHFEVAADDCIATGRGFHHDFPNVDEEIEAVFFETTLTGPKRRGHLWEHTHGPAKPDWPRQ